MMAVANIEPRGVVPWGKAVPCPDAGVYVVSLDPGISSVAAALEAAPLSPTAVDGLLSVRPELTIDGVRPTRHELAER